MNQATTANLPSQNAGMLTRNATIATLIMALAAALAWLLTPTHRLADENPIRLESMIPTTFGEWQVDTKVFAGVVNPQQTELINRLYSQTLSRTYVNARTGERVMLSIAYGEDQRDGMQMHYPEVCYPAQGFLLVSSQRSTLSLDGYSVPIKRLETTLGRHRHEPVTYWTTVGGRVVVGGFSKKLAELRYGLKQVIPDGLLFRVSTIGPDSKAGFDRQDRFIRDLVAVLPADARKQLTGSL